MPPGKRKRAEIQSTEPLEEEVEESIEKPLEESIDLIDEWEQRRIRREEWLKGFTNRASFYQQYEANHGAQSLQALHDELINKQSEDDDDILSIDVSPPAEDEDSCGGRSGSSLANFLDQPSGFLDQPSGDVDDAMSIDASPSAEDEVSCDGSVALSLANFLDQKEHNDGEEITLRRSARKTASRYYLSTLMTTSAVNSKKYEGPPEITVTMERGYQNLPEQTKRNFEAINKEAFDVALSKFNYLLTQVLIAMNENLVRLLHGATRFPNEVINHIAAFTLDQPLPFLAQRVMQKRNETESKSIIPLHGWTDEHSIEGEAINLANASLFEGGSVTIFRLTDPRIKLTDMWFSKLNEHVVNSGIDWELRRIAATSTQTQGFDTGGRSGPHYYTDLVLSVRPDNSASMPSVNAPTVQPSEQVNTEDEDDFGATHSVGFDTDDREMIDVVEISSTAAVASAAIDIDRLSGSVEEMSMTEPPKQIEVVRTKKTPKKNPGRKQPSHTPQQMQQPTHTLLPLNQLRWMFSPYIRNSYDQVWWNKLEEAYEYARRGEVGSLNRGNGNSPTLGVWANTNRRCYGQLDDWKKQALGFIGFH